MNNRFITIILALLFALTLNADELSDKMKQLDKLKKDLQSAEKKVQQSEKKKTQNQSRIQSAQSTKKKTDAELKVSQRQEKEKRDMLNLVSSELRTVEEQIRDLNSLQNIQLSALIRRDLASRTNKLRHRDQHYLALMSTQTRNKLDNLGVVQGNLTIEKERKSTEHKLVLQDVRSKATTIQRLDRDVRNLESENKKLDREQKKMRDQIARLRKDAAELESLISRLTSRTDDREPASYKFSARTIAWPLKGRIIRQFGEETRSYGTSVVCNGIEIAAPEWTPVVAADKGEVVFSGSYGGQGKLVIIDHKNGFFTVYAYNNELLVSKGASVKKGQQIAKSGATGSASQPSLHFELRKDGKAVNPLSYLE
ncbi:MAG: peptidoglycan DD-metalloendopeptidase family protein [Candidatus Cloacimonadota bacterium]|jgi:septal ring factor EnvC (AmiA/AmiB activator)|nr:peptidoglycan DD-metalloendopeptidase family protein [Candidatus Cloacimonadota bacterium]